VQNANGKLQKLRELQAAKKKMYTSKMGEQTKTQTMITELLQTKASWGIKELQSYTQLYADLHNMTTNIQEAQRELQSVEEELEDAHQALIDAIRDRYHEEQIWSDQIRGMSTMVTIALIAFNAIIFATIHIVIEPRKRKKLLKNIQNIMHENDLKMEIRDEQLKTLIYDTRNRTKPSRPSLSASPLPPVVEAKAAANFQYWTQYAVIALPAAFLGVIGTLLAAAPR